MKMPTRPRNLRLAISMKTRVFERFLHMKIWRMLLACRAICLWCHLNRFQFPKPTTLQDVSADDADAPPKTPKPQRPLCDLSCCAMLSAP